MAATSSAKRHVWITGVGIVLALGLLLAGETAWAGTIYSWGLDNYGQVGNTPSGPGFAAIAAGPYHNLALQHDGSIVSWGNHDYGLFDDTPSGTGFIAIAAGGDIDIAGHLDHGSYSLAIDGANGTLVSWGDPNNPAVFAMPTAEKNFTAIAAGGYHGLALKADGSLVSWGLDDDGQVGNTPSGTGFVAIATGGYHSLALKADGSIVAWGNNDHGQVSNTPTATVFGAIAGGGAHSAALTPEPATFVLLAAGAVGLLGYSWKRRRRG
jgi:alpha-tubulin suppressor-like RCC1 family protein